MSRAARALALLSLIACAKTPRDDEPKIRAILDAEARVDRALAEADNEKDPEKAASILETKAIPIADEGIAIADAQTPATDWGRKEKDALRSLLRDRRDSIPGYAASLRSSDLEVKLAAMEKQKTLEKRALEVVTEASRVPN